MLAKPVRRDEQIKLIMECRQSGLTDFEWCRQHNINAGTFYNWVKRLKHTEGITFPRGAKGDGTLTYRQEVVKLDVLQTPAPLPGTNDQYNNSVAMNGARLHRQPVAKLRNRNLYRSRKRLLFLVNTLTLCAYEISGTDFVCFPIYAGVFPARKMMGNV